MAGYGNIANLRMFPKGVSGNPSGRAKLPEELRGILSLSRHEVTKIISKYFRMTFSELVEAMKDPKIPTLHLAICGILMKSIDSKDEYLRLSFLLDQCVGKVPQSIEEDPEDSAERERLAKLSLEELAMEVLKQQKEK